MLIQTRHTHHKALLKLLQHVVACREGQIRVAELAEITGFSRAHFTRLFTSALGETPAEFERRIRLERACHMLIERKISVLEASAFAEYANPEAFTRAFRTVYGYSPSKARLIPDRDWHLNAPSGVHWLPSGELDSYRPVGDTLLPVRIMERPAKRLAVLRHTGDYGLGHKSWAELARYVPSRPWQLDRTPLYGIYHDDPMKVRIKALLRSDFGYEIGATESVPDGLRVLDVPGGVFVATEHRISHTDYSAMWQKLNSEWLPRRGSRPINLPAIDEFESWPLPWEKRSARLILGLDIELGPISSES